MAVLDSKAYKNYDYISRYTRIPYYFHTIDKKYIYGTGTHLNNETPYQLYEIKRGDTPDSLALRFYNNPTYY